MSSSISQSSTMTTKSGSGGKRLSGNRPPQRLPRPPRPPWEAEAAAAARSKRRRGREALTAMVRRSVLGVSSSSRGGGGAWEFRGPFGARRVRKRRKRLKSFSIKKMEMFNC